MSKENIKMLKITDGGYNLVQDTLIFSSNIGDIAMDLWSALEVAYTLVDCVGLDYDKHSMQQVEEKIVDREENV